MNNANTTYWERVIAFFDREVGDAQWPDSTRSMAARGKSIATKAQALNTHVTELEAQVQRIRTALIAIKTRGNGVSPYSIAGGMAQIAESTLMKAVVSDE